MKDKLLSPGGMLVMGGLMGILSKLSDVGSHMGYLQIILSEMTSQMSLWILIGVTISLFSRSRKMAMANIFLFCVGMLAAYYVAAEVTHSVYGWSFIKGWAVFACFSPVMAYLVTLTKEKGRLPLLIKIGVLAAYVGVDLLLFGGPQIFDIVLLLPLLYLLFVRKYANGRKI